MMLLVKMLIELGYGSEQNNVHGWTYTMNLFTLS